MPKNYMTSLPQTADTQKSYIKTVNAPKVPAMDFRSGFKDVATAVNDTNKFLDGFSKMKYEGFQADLDRLELQHLHEMQDAKDPCELEELNQKWDNIYNNALKDDVWSRSYYKSTFYENWKNRNEAAKQKIYYQKQHEFAEIVAVDTLNKMAETASLLDNPADVAQYLKNGEAMLANTEHLTAENKYKLMTNFYKDTVNRIYDSDPNKAVAWLDYAGNKYDGYGVSSEEIRSKADAYNKAKQREMQADIARAEKQKVQQEKVDGLALAQQLAMGEISESEANLKASELSPIAWNEFRKATPKGSKKDKVDYQPVHDVFLSDDEDKIQSWNDYKLNHPELSSAQITRGDNLAKIFETKDTSKNPITVGDEIKVGQVQSGELTMSDKDIEDNSHGNATLAKEFRNARSAYNKSLADKLKAESAEKEKTEKEKKTEEEKLQAKEEKKQEQQLKDKSNLALANVNFASDEKVADVFKENLKDLTPADMKIAALRVKNARDNLAKKTEKAKGEKKKELDAQIKALETAERNARFNIMYDALEENPDAYTDEQINNADIEQSQKEKLKQAKKSSEKEFDASQKQLLADTRREINAGISSKWEKGQMITNIDDILANYPYADNQNRQTVYDWLIKGNKVVADSNWAGIKNDFYTYIQQQRDVSDKELQDFINKLDNQGTGKNYQEMYEDLDKIRQNFRNSKNTAINDALNKFDIIWGTPVYGSETNLEKQRKAEAKNYYHNLLINNQDKAEAFNTYSSQDYISNQVVAKLKPNRRTVNQFMNTSISAVSTLDSLRNDVAKYDKKTKTWNPKAGLSFDEISHYQDVVDNAYHLGFISQKDRNSYASIVQEPLAISLQESEKKQGTVLGYMVTSLKNKILGENYNPAEMSSLVNSVFSMYPFLHSTDSIEVGIFDKWANKEQEISDRRNAIDVGVELIKENYYKDKKADALAKGGNIIVLGGTK